MKGSVPRDRRANLISSAKDFAVFMSMLETEAFTRGREVIGRKTIDLMRTNTSMNAVQDSPTLPWGGLWTWRFRTVIDKRGAAQRPIGAFGWTGGAGTWAEAGPERGSCNHLLTT